MCCHILGKVHSIFDFVWATTPGSIKYTVNNHHFLEPESQVVPDRDLLRCLLQSFCCFDDAEVSPWSVSSPNGATCSCSWASSWWSWHCCPERDTRRGFPTSSASSASLTPLVWQAATTQQQASLEGMYMPTSPTYPNLIAMEMACPTARRRPLL